MEQKLQHISVAQSIQHFSIQPSWMRVQIQWLKTSMEGMTLISIQLETIAILIASVPNPLATTKDLRVDVKVEEIKVKVMEE
jgi:hypothetical protein